MGIIFTSLISFAILAVTLTPTAASSSDVRCPDTQAGTALTTVTLFDGPASEKAALVPDTSQKTADGTRSRWSVAYIFQAGRRLYVECQYGPKSAPITLVPEPSTYQCEFLSGRTAQVSLSCQAR